MSALIETTGLSKSFTKLSAVDQVSLAIEGPGIYGLLGRNGAGKSTLMNLMAGHEIPTSGQTTLLGQNPVTSSSALADMIFIKESQVYPENFKVSHAIKMAAALYENFDSEFAAELVAKFKLPTKRLIRKLSRGQFSAVGVVIGLASRASITFLDEPYLGMDAAARAEFYDVLLADYAEHPRLIVLSTHLIDEVADLLEHVFVIDDGKIILDSNTDDLKGQAMSIEGDTEKAEAFALGKEVLDRKSIASMSRISLMSNPQLFAEAESLGLNPQPLSLQQLIIASTGTKELENA